MPKRKKKPTLSSHQHTLILSSLLTAVVVMCFALLVHTTYAAKRVKITPESLFGTCPQDPSSTDTTPPTIEVINPKDGGHVYSQTSIDADPSLKTHLEIIVRDNDNPYGSAWFSKGRGGGAMIPEDEAPYYTIDENGTYVMRYHNYDAVANPKPAGKPVTITFGACDKAGNKAYAKVTVTTIK